MDGENTNGGQEATQGGTQEQESQGQQQEPQGTQEVTGGNTDWEAQIAQRDQRIAELEGQVEFKLPELRKRVAQIRLL